MPIGSNGMKNKKTLGLYGKGKRKAAKYTDEYIEDFYEEEDFEEQGVLETDFENGNEDEYIVAYSSENTVFGAYTSEQMQEYAEEYAEQQEEEPQEYGGAEDCGEQQEYDETEEYEEPDEYGETLAYEKTEECVETAEYDKTEECGQQEYDRAEQYDETEECGQQEYDRAEQCDETEECEQQEYVEAGDGSLDCTTKIDVGIYKLAEDGSLYITREIEIENKESENNGSEDDAEDIENDYENVGERARAECETEYDASDEYYDDAYVNDEYVEEMYADDEYSEGMYDDDEYIEGTYDSDVFDEELYDGDAYDEEMNDSDAYDEELYDGDAYDEALYDGDEYLEETDDGQYGNESYDEDSFEIAYGDFEEAYESDDEVLEEVEEPLDFWQRAKMRLRHMTAFDAVLVSTGVVVLVAAFVILNMFMQSRQINKQIEALAPLGNDLKEIGVVGGDGLLSMANAALSGNFAQTESAGESDSGGDLPLEVIDTPDSGKVNVNFESVERDLKIRFTDVNTGGLITGTVFEVTLTNAKGKQLILKDEDMDGIIYAQNVNAGVFDAVVTSTDKYKFPTIAQQVTVKDKVEYVVINVQDEVKTEKQINVAAEDTEKNVAAVETETLKDTVEWVESTKTPVSGSESYLLVDKNTIADPSQVSKAAARMLFDTLNVALEPANATLSIGSSIDLKGTEVQDRKEGDIEYQYTVEWKSSDDSVASVNGGKVTAKAAGEAVITYTVTRKTITTTYENKEPIEETVEISTEEYNKDSFEAERGKCTEIKDDSGEIIGYKYTKVTEQEPEKKTSETTESASAECKITVEPAKITSGSLELSRSADSCAVGATLTVKPAKLVYTKQDGSTETLTDQFPSIAWESSDKAIATVGSDGVVTGVKPGKVHITGKITGVNGADGNELNISTSVEISVTEAADLALTLDRTSDVYLAVGGSTTLVATVTNYQSDAGVTWETSDKKVATVDEKGVVTGVAAGSVKITATTKEKDKSGNQKQATCVVTINSNATSDTTTKLKDKNGNQIYVKNSDGSYREAVYADYYSSSEFYIAAQANYVYTGWQTLDGKTYYYDKNGNVVTGTQIIQGVTYNFGTDGAIATTVNGSTFGIDVSRHNGTIDWNAVKASGVDYVIIRCGYRGSSTGALIEDQNFKANIRGATAAGLKVGVYVFSQAVDEVEAVKEASLAVSLVKGYNLTYPIFIDTEASGGRADKIDKATRTAVVNAFCQTVASAGYQPGIYASKTWFEDKLNMGGVTSCRIWLAQYSAEPTYKGKYDLWQYSSKGKISGINTDVDLNYSYTGY